MRLARIAIAACAAAALAGSPARAQEWQDVRIQTVQAGPGVYMLIGRGGNIGVSAGKDGVFLVDDQYAPLTERIREAVAAISRAPIRFLLNTHWHADHTGGNENLGGAGVLIVAHDNVRKRMSIEQFMESLGDTIPPAPEAALPVVTFNDAVTFHLNGDEVHAFHVEAAHTDGDAIIHFRKAGVIHMGDTYFNGTYPFIDVGSGGSIDGTIAAADRALALAGAATRIIPGHGPLSNRDELRAYRDMLATVRDRVAREIAAGRTLEEVVAAKPTADLDAVWGKGFMTPERFVTLVYRDLSARAATSLR